MSILIPGMKMPTSWEDCAFSNEFAACTLDKDLTVCAFARMGNGCPIIEIPPHGDLIDREKIPFVEAEWACDDYAIRYDINEMTPVIPADPEGGTDNV